MLQPTLADVTKIDIHANRLNIAHAADSYTTGAPRAK
jgi:hypothetical protein